MAALLIGIAVTLAAGCTGATVHSIPVIRADLPPNERLVNTLRADEAYYWTDEAGRLYLALRRHDASLLLGPAFDFDWLLSLDLEGLPAGRQRLYTFTVRELRMTQQWGGNHRRGRAISGVAVIDAPRAGRLSGRFHATVQMQHFTVLEGWSPLYRGPLVVMAGEFAAIRDERRGRAILEQTEAEGFGRGRPHRENAPASRPAAATAPAGQSDPDLP